jgi:hypothetical protein
MDDGACTVGGGGGHFTMYTVDSGARRSDRAVEFRSKSGGVLAVRGERRCRCGNPGQAKAQVEAGKKGSGGRGAEAMRRMGKGRRSSWHEQKLAGPAAASHTASCCCCCD